jgi:hypothetical protein
MIITITQLLVYIAAVRGLISEDFAAILCIKSIILKRSKKSTGKH